MGSNVYIVTTIPWSLVVALSALSAIHFSSIMASFQHHLVHMLWIGVTLITSFKVLFPLTFSRVCCWSLQCQKGRFQRLSKRRFLCNSILGLFPVSNCYVPEHSSNWSVHDWSEHQNSIRCVSFDVAVFLTYYVASSWCKMAFHVDNSLATLPRDVSVPCYKLCFVGNIQ